MINELGKKAHEINVKNGFYEGQKNTGEMIALIHSELSEALEADRAEIQNPVFDPYHILDTEDDDEFKSLFEGCIKDSFEDELADAMIRIMDLATYKNIDLENNIKAKMRYNSLREYKHGKKY